MKDCKDRRPLRLQYGMHKQNGVGEGDFKMCVENMLSSVVACNV